MGDAKRNTADRASIVTNIVVILIALTLVVQSDSSVVEWWRARTDEAATLSAIDDAWEDLVGEGGVIGSTQTGEHVLVEFGDYQCPYCRSAHQVLESVTAADSSVTVVYRHLPLTQLHPLAEEAARASICAERAGLFQTVHRFLYENQEWQASSDRLVMIKELESQTPARVEACMAAAATSERLARDVALATELGVRSTPTFLGPRGIHVGVPQPDDIDRILGR